MCAAAGFWAGREAPAHAVRFAQDPFSLGVASGYPTHDSVVLWTRLAPMPLEPGGGLPPVPIEVHWELATDERMRHVVRRGTEFATPEWAHSIHVEPAGLEPARRYWYRFTAGGARSPIGQTRTAPASAAADARLKLAVASCQHYEQGYFGAYRHIVRDDPDVIVHLGDYIYETSWGKNPVRSHNASEALTLDDYRVRHALYKTDPDLAAAHAAAPWLLVWDDHEVANDYAGSGFVAERFRRRRAAAYQAYYEHMPLPWSSRPSGAHMHLYTQRAFGDLASLFMLDQRQYRSPKCRSSQREADDRSMLGRVQESWLREELGRSRTRWNLLAQGTVVSEIPCDQEAGAQYGADAWNGYPAARARLLEALDSSKAANPVLLSGDIHAFLVSGLNRDPANFATPLVVPEFACSSISSEPHAQSGMQAFAAVNPNVEFASSEHRGYLRLELTAKQLQVDLVGLESAKRRDSSASAVRSYVVESGDPRAHAA